MSKISDHLPGNQEMMGLMWDIAENPNDLTKDVIGRYCGLIARAVIESDVEALRVLSDNLELPATAVKYNGWIEANTFKRLIKECLDQLGISES